MPTIDRLSSLAARFNRARAAFTKMPKRFVGIDIGVREVAIASLHIPSSKRKKPSNELCKHLQWQSCYRLPIDLDPTKAPTPEWVHETTIALLDRLPRCVDGENNPAVLSLPAPWTHYQVVSGNDLANSQLQCDEMFQNSIFQSPAKLGHWPIVGLKHGTPNEDDQYLVTATAEKAACQIAEAVSSVGYNVQSILPHGVALVHAAKPLTSISTQCIAMLNRDGGSVAINHDSGCGLCRTLPAVPAQVLNQAGDGILSLNDIRPWLSDIAAEINATIRYSARANMAGPNNEPILICGDLCEIPNLDATLAKLTNRPIARWRYSSRLRPNRRQMHTLDQIQSDPEIAANDSRFALALSLAHQSFSLCNGDNLL